jgi:hypothetical protein
MGAAYSEIIEICRCLSADGQCLAISTRIESRIKFNSSSTDGGNKL